MDLNGKRIVITGASSGLGLDVLTLLLKYNVRILAVGRNMEYIPQNEKVFPLQCDVSSKEGVEKVFAEAEEKLGGIDLFWANAGFGYFEQFGQPDWEKMEAIFHTNVLSPFYSLEKMLTLYPNQKIRFMVTDSMAGQMEVPGYALYVATKFAMNGGMGSIQYELPERVTLSIIYPIATSTRFFDRAGASLKKAGPVQSSEACARAILKGIKKDRKRIYPYPLWPVIYTIISVFPFIKRLILRVQNKELQRVAGK
ncbi:MAG: SDR family NAD(P)-dependent oxidoreductase [Bacteroidales bacterium]|nr:SDR family NAD(P)-dependent oxidoreductase [Bacteroidales bacterium]